MSLDSQIIIALNQEPSKIGFILSIKNLSTILENANQQYFDNGSSFLTDNSFDILLDILRERSPNNPLFKKIGADVHDDGIKVQLPFPMKSLDKVKPFTKQLAIWLGKFKGPFIVSEKIDGLSGLLVIKYEKGNDILTVSLYKRGDGTKGQDVSHLIKYIQTKPYGNNKIDTFSTLNKETQTYLKKNGLIVVRGELIMETKTYHSKYDKKYPKCRALIAGITNSKTIPKDIAADIQFVAYQLIQPDGLKMSDQFAFMKDNFFLAQYTTSDSLNEDILQPMLLKFKKESKYEIDGIVLTDDTQFYETPKDGNPKHSVAFKMLLDEQVKMTKVINVEYNVSKHGVLVPRVEFEQVVIGGSKISFATGFHGKFIKENNIGPGAEIQLVLSGDVIPYIYKVTKGIGNGKWQKPNVEFVWSDSSIELLVKNKDQHAGVRLKRLIHFFKTLEIDGVGPAIVERFYNSNYDDINKIIGLPRERIASMVGFQLKSASKVYEAIHKVVDKPIELGLLMTASNIFENGFGQRKLKPVLTTYPNILSDIKTYSTRQMIDRMVQIEGYSDKTATQFVNYLPTFVEWLSRHPSLVYYIHKEDTSAIKKNGKMVGQFILFTGKRDNELEAKIIEEGGTIVNTISTKTTLLVAKDINSGSSKITKATQLNIPVISYQDFITTHKL